MEEAIKKLKQELERSRLELNILYEISNAMRTTLKLDEILYIILTGVTAHTGLGFNRAMLFLVNEKDGLIEGRMGIGPENADEASRIWTRIESQKMDLEDLINVYKNGDSSLETNLNRQIRSIKAPLYDKETSLLSLAALEGMPLQITSETIDKYKNYPLIRFLNAEEVVLIPLKAKDKVNGIIVADNFVTHDPITKDDIRMLMMLANQAGLAIENSHLYEKTVTKGHTDQLTDLWNHGYFQYLLYSEIEKAKATKSVLSLIMIDLDDFKVYNDTLGHQMGDIILREVANLLKNQSRKMDYVCRYGGEEFTIILPKTEKKEALTIAQRLSEDFRNHAFAQENIMPKKQLTISMGVAAFPDDADNPPALILASDKALYQAKHKGKNNICC